MGLSASISISLKPAAINALLLVIAAFVLSACSSEETLPANWREIEEPALHFSLSLPATCSTTHSPVDQPNYRMDAQCPGGQLITLFVVQIKGVVDEEKLAEDADRMWAGGLSPEETIYKPDVFFLIRWLDEDQIFGTTKIFGKDGKVRVIATEAHGRFAYYLLMDGRGEARDDFLRISRLLKVKFSVGEAAFTVLFYLGTALLAWPLGLLGFWARKSRMKLKFLKTLSSQANIDTLKVQAERNRTIWKFMLSPVCCVILYGLGFYLIGHYFDDLSFAIFAIVGPFLPILGYFGLIREPTEGDLPERL